MAALSIQMAGTAGYVDMALMYGDMPIRYYQQDEWDEASNLSGILMLDDFQNRTVACYRCPIACGRETRAPNYGLEKVDGPEYETLGALGSLVMVDDQEAVIVAGHLCNVYGLDTISTGATIALACELFERGILTTADTGGLEIRYGDAAMVHRLIEMMAKREGFGAVLADGSQALAERFGVAGAGGHGQQTGSADARSTRLQRIGRDLRALAARRVPHAGRYVRRRYRPRAGLRTGHRAGRALRIIGGEGAYAARQQAWRTLYNAMILCQFQNPGVERVLGALNAITGWDLAIDDLMTLGKRIVTLKRQLNLRRGLTRADERLPELLLQPLDGGTEGNVPDLDALLDWRLRGIRMECGNRQTVGRRH